MPWVEDFSQPALRAIGALELLGALGVAGPTVLRRFEVLTPLAATGLGLVMVGSFVTHLRRGELTRSSSTALLLALAWHVVSRQRPASSSTTRVGSGFTTATSCRKRA